METDLTYKSLLDLNKRKSSKSDSCINLNHRCMKYMVSQLLPRFELVNLLDKRWPLRKGPAALLKITLQIKATRCHRCHLTPVRMAKIKNTRNNKCWQGHGQKGILGGNVNYYSHPGK